MKAAHFLLSGDLVSSPPNEAIISALLEFGFQVDLFGPEVEQARHDYGSRVHLHDFSYSRRNLINGMMRGTWRGYSCFSGTSENPLGVVGVLSFLGRKPSIILADEIKSGSYRGDAPESWKRLCRWGMRRATFQIVNDESRIELQRNYCHAGKNQPIIVFPGCFRSPPQPADRSGLRTSWGFSENDRVIGFSGGFSLATGADWLLSAIQANQQLRAVIQPVNVDPMVFHLLDCMKARDRVFVTQKRLGWADAWAQAAGFDIGVCVYRNQAPQFQQMGISSNRLCMFLAMGVPVIASRQPSFKFIEDYDCGVLVQSEAEFIEAIELIGSRLDSMKANALGCAKEYIDAPGRYQQLKATMASSLDLSLPVEPAG